MMKDRILTVLLFIVLTSSQVLGQKKLSVQQIEDFNIQNASQQSESPQREASLILGQLGFSESQEGNTRLYFQTAYHSAVSSKGVLAVTASGLTASGVEEGGRVLIWKKVPESNGVLPDVILGRSSFVDEYAGTSRSRMKHSRGVAFSPDGKRLLISDGDRILVWNKIPTTNGQPADLVIGANDFQSRNTSKTISANRFDFIQGITVTKGGILLVCDRSRVLIFNQIPTENGASADVVVGQDSFTTNRTGSGRKRFGPIVRQVVVTREGKLLVADALNHRISVFNQIPKANGAAADYVIGQKNFNNTDPISFSDLIVPNGIAVSEQGVLAVSGGYFPGQGGRIMIYNTVPETSGVTPDYVIGQSSRNSLEWLPWSKATVRDSEGLTFHENRLYIGGRNSKRLIGFDVKAASPTEALQMEPLAGNGGQKVNITGHDLNFNKLKSINYKGKNVAFTVISDHVLETTVPADAVSGNFKLSIDGREYDSPVFSVYPVEPKFSARNITAVKGCSSVDLRWDKRDGTNSLVILREKTNSNQFVPKDGKSYEFSTSLEVQNRQTGNFVVYSGSKTNVTITGLKQNREYVVTVFTSNGSGSNSNYRTRQPGTRVFNTDEVLTPTVPVTSLQVAENDKNSVSFLWTKGAGERTMVVLKKASDKGYFRPINCTYYPSDPVFGMGNELNDNFVVYSGLDETCTVTGLEPNTKYIAYFYTYTKPENGKQVYLADDPPIRQFRTASQSAGDLAIYPNPFTSQVTVKLRNSSKNDQVVIRVFDQQGFEIMSFDLKKGFPRQLGAELGSGLYIVRSWDGKSYGSYLISKE